MQTQAVVYWIHLPEHVDPKTEGYVGVTARYEKRLVELKNSHKNPYLVDAVKKYGWENLIKEILFSGEENECYEMAINYRPSMSTGWNISPGGHNGPHWAAARKSKPKIDRQSDFDRAKKCAIRKLRLEARALKRVAKNAAIEKKQLLMLAKKQYRLEQKLKQTEKRKEKLKRETKKQEIDLSKRPFCSNCNQQRRAINYWSKGIPHFRKLCNECNRNKPKVKSRKPNWAKNGYKKKPNCDLCGFKSIYPSQITIFHIDGNLQNTQLINLKSICLNCVEIVKRKQLNWKRGDLEVDY